MHDGAEPHTTQDIPVSLSSAIQSSQQKAERCGKIGGQQLALEKEENEEQGNKNSSGNNMVIKHGNDMDDHHTYTQGSKSDCENYELHNYETILMITEKFQTNYDVFGRLLEIQMQFIHIRC